MICQTQQPKPLFSLATAAFLAQVRGMEPQAQIPRNAPQSASEPIRDASDLPTTYRNRRRGKMRLLSRENLDGRTAAARVFDRLVGEITADLGGADQLSAIEKALIQGFAGAAVAVQDVNARMALGQVIEVSDLAQSISAMVRVASRLGEQRRMRDVNGVARPQQSSVRADLVSELHENQG
jgi:hypothetical protein